MTEVPLLSAQQNTKLDSHDRNSVDLVPIEKAYSSQILYCLPLSVSLTEL